MDFSLFLHTFDASCKYIQCDNCGEIYCEYEYCHKCNKIKCITCNEFININNPGIVLSEIYCGNCEKMLAVNFCIKNFVNNFVEIFTIYKKNVRNIINLNSLIETSLNNMMMTHAHFHKFVEFYPKMKHFDIVLHMLNYINEYFGNYLDYQNNIEKNFVISIFVTKLFDFVSYENKNINIYDKFIAKKNSCFSKLERYTLFVSGEKCDICSCHMSYERHKRIRYFFCLNCLQNNTDLMTLKYMED